MWIKRQITWILQRSIKSTNIITYNPIKMAFALKNEYYQAVAVCNLGIIQADKEFDEFLDTLSWSFNFKWQNDKENNKYDKYLFF